MGERMTNCKRAMGWKLLAVVGMAAFSVGTTASAGDKAMKGAHHEAKKEAHRIGKAEAKSDAYLDGLAIFNAKQVAMGEMAMQRAQSPEVREFAQQLVQDHRQNMDDWIAWAGTQDIEMMAADLSMPMMGTGGSGMATMEDKAYDKSMKHADKQMDKRAMEAQKELDTLAEKEGMNFDKAFLSHAIKDQEKGKKMLGKGEKRFEADPAFASLIAKTDTLVMGHIAEGKRLHHHVK
jgi:predicted outer membrane protein